MASVIQVFRETAPGRSAREASTKAMIVSSTRRLVCVVAMVALASITELHGAKMAPMQMFFLCSADCLCRSSRYMIGGALHTRGPER